MMFRNHLVSGLAVAALCGCGGFAARGGTIALWTFDDPNQSLADASGNGNTLECDKGVTIVDGVARLDGSQRMFNTIGNLNLSSYTAVTVEFWARFNAADNAGTVFFMEQSPVAGSNPGAFYLDIGEKGSGVLGMWTTGSANMGVDNGTAALGDGQWHHIAYERNRADATANGSRMFVDGEDVSDHVAFPDLIQPGSTRVFADKVLYIGSRNNEKLFFTGELDNIRISSGMLSKEQFIRLDGTVGSPEPIAYWPFGAAGTADVSGNGRLLSVSSPGVSFESGAVRLDGSQAFRLMSGLPIDLADYANGVTIECWFNAPVGASGTQILMELTPRCSSPGTKGGFYVALNDLGFTVDSQVRTTTAGYHADGATKPVADGAWHHLALVFSPTEEAVTEICRFYLDGEVQSQHTQYNSGGLDRLTNGHLFLGSRNNTEHRFTGLLDDVRITPCALEPNQFLQTRTADAPQPWGLWTFTRGLELQAEFGAGTDLAASQVTFANGTAEFAGAGTLTTQTLPDETAAPNLTLECLYRTDAETETVPLTSLFSVGSWDLVGALPGTSNAWAQAALVFEGAAYKVFLNGVEATELAGTLASSRPGAALVVGSGFTGAIDDLRVVPAALGPGAFQKGHSDDTPMTIAHWKFNSWDGLRDETGRYSLSGVAGVRYGFYEDALSVDLGRGLQTPFALVLSPFRSFTVECQFRSTSSQKGNLLEQSVNYNNFSGAFCLSEGMYMSCPGAGFKTSNGYSISTASDLSVPALKDGAWHRMAYTVKRGSSGLQTHLYIDGVEYQRFGEFVSTTDTPFLDSELFFGSRAESRSKTPSWDSFCSFVGDLDEVRITNGELTPEELLTDEDRTAREPQTLADWTFDDPDHPLADASGKGNDLTGSVLVENGLAKFDGTAGLRTVQPMVFPDHSQVTLEMVFRTTEPVSSAAILYELSADYNGNSGAIASYVNPNGSFDVAMCGLAYQSTTKDASDCQWHYLTVVYDLMQSNKKAWCTFQLDGLPAVGAEIFYNATFINGYTALRNDTFFIGSRNMNGCFFTGEIDRVRITSGILAPEHRLARTRLRTDADGVVAYWPFNRQADWLNDASGNGRALAAMGENGVAYKSSQGCAAFTDKEHDVLRAANKIDFGALGSFTVECFAKSTNGVLLGTSVYTANMHGFNLSDSPHPDGGVRQVATLVEGAAAPTGDFTCPINYVAWGTRRIDEAWHHYAFVYDRDYGANGYLFLYMDGEKIANDVALQLPFRPVASDFEIGSIPGGVTTNRFVGLIDDVRITAAALRPEQFLQKRTPGQGLVLVVR